MTPNILSLITKKVQLPITWCQNEHNPEQVKTIQETSKTKCIIEKFESSFTNIVLKVNVHSKFAFSFKHTVLASRNTDNNNIIKYHFTH